MSVQYSEQPIQSQSHEGLQRTGLHSSEHLRQALSIRVHLHEEPKLLLPRHSHALHRDQLQSAGLTGSKRGRAHVRRFQRLDGQDVRVVFAHGGDCCHFVDGVARRRRARRGEWR